MEELINTNKISNIGCQTDRNNNEKSKKLNRDESASKIPRLNKELFEKFNN